MEFGLQFPAGTIGRGTLVQRYIEAGRFERGDEG